MAAPPAGCCRRRPSPGRGCSGGRCSSRPSCTTTPASGRGRSAPGGRPACQTPSPPTLDLDARDRAAAGPGLAADGVPAGREHRAGRGFGDPRADAHDGDRLVRAVGPLEHVVAGLELADVRLEQHVDARQPLHRRDRVPVRHDQPEGRSVIGRQRLAVHRVRDQDLGGRVDRRSSGRERSKPRLLGIGLRQHRLQQVRPVVGALETDLDAGRRAGPPAPGRR